MAGADPVGVECDKELCVQNVLYEPVDGAAGVAGADPVGVECDKELCVQSVLYEPVDGAAGVAGADPVGVEGDKELCVQNVLYEPVDGAAGVAGADPVGVEGQEEGEEGDEEDCQVPAHHEQARPFEPHSLVQKTYIFFVIEHEIFE